MKEVFDFLKQTKHLKKNRFLVVIVYILDIARVSAMMIQPILFSHYLIDKVIKEGQRDLLPKIIVMSLCLTFLSFLFNFAIGMIQRFLSIRRTLSLREFVLKHLRSISIFEIDKESPAKFGMLLGEDTNTAADFFINTIFQLFSEVYMLIFGIATLFYLDWKLGASGICVIVILTGIPFLIKKPLAHHLERVRKHMEEIGQVLFETVEGSKEIKTLGLEGWEKDKNDKIYEGLVRSSVFESVFNILSSGTTQIIISVIVIFVYWMGSKLIFNDQLTIGLLVLAVMYLQQTLQRIQAINEKYGAYRRATIAIKRLLNFFTIEKEPYLKNPTIKLEDNTEPIINVDNLSLTIGNVNILKNISLQIPHGKKTAIIGLSGSGKTTLYKILLGFMPVQKGDIRVKGASIRTFSREMLNKTFGWVSQAPFLFKGTLKENITLANRSVSDEEIMEAAINANLGELIEKLPDGLNTELTNKGLQLSGGERQRIVIARMFLKKPQILLLDEPTSSLDRITEKDVIDALNKLMVGQTTVISTHRLDSIEDADHIVVLSNGAVVARGNHTELVGESEIYRKMIKKFSEELNDTQSH